MKSIMKTIALGLIICFLGSICWGQDKITFKTVLTPISAIFYENNVGIDTPTLGQEFKLHVQTFFNDEQVTNISVKDDGGFSTLGNPEIEDRDNSSWLAFPLKAPQNEGTYKITFEGRTKTGQVFDFSTDIKVVQNDQSQTWMQIGLIVGVVVVVAALGLLLANRK